MVIAKQIFLSQYNWLIISQSIAKLWRSVSWKYDLCSSQIDIALYVKLCYDRLHHEEDELHDAF